DIKLSAEPAFLSYRPDVAEFKKIAAEFKNYKNILIVGNGGSLNTVIAFCEPLRESLTKAVYYLNTVDPDYIFELKQKLKPAETLVIAISKSGETTTQIESLMQFAAYPMLMITGQSSSLRAI